MCFIKKKKQIKYYIKLNIQIRFVLIIYCIFLIKLYIYYKNLYFDKFFYYMCFGMWVGEVICIDRLMIVIVVLFRYVLFVFVCFLRNNIFICVLQSYECIFKKYMIIQIFDMLLYNNEIQVICVLINMSRKFKFY